MSTTVSWNDQRVFLAVIEEGSLTGAARRLGLSHPTVRARIAALEAALGTTLFTRSVNGLTPTDHAADLHAAARSMAAASDLFIRQAAAPSGEAAGIVRISVSEFNGVEVIPPVIARLRTSHPRIRIELVLSNLSADLLAGEVDIAIRNTQPVQTALIARKVPPIALGLYASQAYLRRRGLPLCLNDLAAHDLIGPDKSLSDIAVAEQVWPGFDPAHFVLRTDSHPAVAAAVRAGVGIGVLQVPVAKSDSTLERVIPGLNAGALNTWIVTHEDLRNLPRVRAVFDALVAAFTASDQ
ncbi:MAG: LysR family transcriptional regulator [Rhodanobacter sp.]